MQTECSPKRFDTRRLRYIERIVDGLLSIVATMRVLPVIRCPPGEAAQMIAERLEDHKLQKRPGMDCPESSEMMILMNQIISVFTRST